jgi:hypothetical protein
LLLLLLLLLLLRICCTWHAPGCQLLFFGSLNGRIHGCSGALHCICGSCDRPSSSIVHSPRTLLLLLGHALPGRTTRSRGTRLVRGSIGPCCGAVLRGSLLVVAAGAILLPHEVGKRDGLAVLLLELHLAVLQLLPLLGRQRLVLQQRLVERLGRAAGAVHRV